MCFSEPRFARIGNTFIDDVGVAPTAVRRSRSFSHRSHEHTEMMERAVQFAEEAAARCARDESSTLMLRNIPPDVDQSQLLRKLREFGFGDHLQFVYLPVEFGKGRPVSRGFAFVGLKTQAAADALTEHWQDTWTFGESPGRRPLNLARARVQGYEANMKHWGCSKTKRIQNSRFRPWTASM